MKTLVDNYAKAVSGTFHICNSLLLFEALEMDESEVRLTLEKNAVTDLHQQNMYLEYMDLYRLTLETEKKRNSSYTGQSLNMWPEKQSRKWLIF